MLILRKSLAFTTRKFRHKVPVGKRGLGLKGPAPRKKRVAHTTQAAKGGGQTSGAAAALTEKTRG